MRNDVRQQHLEDALNEPVKYRLHLPFVLQGQYSIGLQDEPVPLPISDLTVSIAGGAGAYTISAEGFTSEASAQAFVPRLWLGLTVLMIDVKAAFAADWDVRPGLAVNVSNPEFPTYFHGPRVAVHAGRPHIVPIGAQLLTVGVGTPSVSVSTPVDRTIQAIARGINHPRAEALVTDSRFRTAVDLYAGAAFEPKGSSRLVSYATALEVLAPPAEREALVLELLKKWEEELEAIHASLDPASDDAAALESLKKTLLFSRQASIRSRIRRFVAMTLSAAGEPDSDAYAGRAVKAYDARSTLVHEGTLAPATIGTSTDSLRVILERLFEARLAAV